MVESLNKKQKAKAVVESKKYKLPKGRKHPFKKRYKKLKGTRQTMENSLNKI